MKPLHMTLMATALCLPLSALAQVLGTIPAEQPAEQPGMARRAPQCLVRGLHQRPCGREVVVLKGTLPVCEVGQKRQQGRAQPHGVLDQTCRRPQFPD